MDVYLPIANLSVNGLWIVALGGLTGILSGPVSYTHLTLPTTPYV